MKKLVAVLLLLAVLPGIIFAGGRGGATTQAPLIGIAMPETHVQRWVKDGNSLRDEAIKRGYRAELAFGDADQGVQNRQIQSFLTQGARALVIGNINDGVATVVREARREGVLVIAYDRIIQGTHDFDYYITFNNFKVGVLQGQSLVEGMNLDSATTANPKYITLFAGSPTDANAFFFFDGAMSVLNPYIDKGVLRVVGPYPKTSADRATFMQIATEGWQAPIAGRRMDDLLAGAARTQMLDAVLAPNDTLARAIITSLRRDARYRDKLPIISGQDAEFDSMVLIRDGHQYSTVFKDTAKLAEAAIIIADQLLRGVPVEVPGAELAGGALSEIGFTGTGYVKTYLLDPVLVTRRNLNVPVDAGFFTDAEAAQLR